MIKINKSGTYLNNLEVLLTEAPYLDSQIAQVIEWFQSNPDDTRLDNHALHGKMEGKWAFSITDDIRIVYKMTGSNTVRFLAIGGHPKVY